MIRQGDKDVLDFRYILDSISNGSCPSPNDHNFHYISCSQVTRERLASDFDMFGLSLREDSSHKDVHKAMLSMDSLTNQLVIDGFKSMRGKDWRDIITSCCSNSNNSHNKEVERELQMLLSMKNIPLNFLWNSHVVYFIEGVDSNDNSMKIVYHRIRLYGGRVQQQLSPIVTHIVVNKEVVLEYNTLVVVGTFLHHNKVVVGTFLH